MKGGATAKNYGCFLLNLIKNNSEIKENLSHYVFFSDNAAIHHAKILTKLYNSLNILFNFILKYNTMFVNQKFKKKTVAFLKLLIKV